MKREANYLPQMVRVSQIEPLSPEVKKFRLEVELCFDPGQIIELSVLGAGEIPVVIASHPAEKYIEVAVRQVGTVTRSLHALELGDQVGVRGPYGNGFPLAELRGKNLILVAGGLGMVPLRPLIKEILRDRDSYREVHLLYGCREAEEFLFDDEFGSEGIQSHLTVDKECRDWQGHIGLVTSFFKELDLPRKNVAAVMCGPPVMFKFVIQELQELPVAAEDIYMSLERHMKCGVGKCQHCNIDDLYVCLDGPVFCYADIEDKNWQGEGEGC